MLIHVFLAALLTFGAYQIVAIGINIVTKQLHVPECSALLFMVQMDYHSGALAHHTIHVLPLSYPSDLRYCNVGDCWPLERNYNIITCRDSTVAFVDYEGRIVFNKHPSSKEIEVNPKIPVRGTTVISCRAGDKMATAEMVSGCGVPVFGAEYTHYFMESTGDSIITFDKYHRDIPMAVLACDGKTGLVKVIGQDGDCSFTTKDFSFMKLPEQSLLSVRLFSESHETYYLESWDGIVAAKCSNEACKEVMDPTSVTFEGTNIEFAKVLKNTVYSVFWAELPYVHSVHLNSTATIGIIQNARLINAKKQVNFERFYIPEGICSPVLGNAVHTTSSGEVDTSLTTATQLDSFVKYVLCVDGPERKLAVAASAYDTTRDPYGFPYSISDDIPEMRNLQPNWFYAFFDKNSLSAIYNHGGNAYKIFHGNGEELSQPEKPREEVLDGFKGIEGNSSAFRVQTWTMSDPLLGGIVKMRDMRNIDGAVVSVAMGQIKFEEGPISIQCETSSIFYQNGILQTYGQGLAQYSTGDSLTNSNENILRIARSNMPILITGKNHVALIKDGSGEKLLAPECVVLAQRGKLNRYDSTAATNGLASIIESRFINDTSNPTGPHIYDLSSPHINQLHPDSAISNGYYQSNNIQSASTVTSNDAEHHDFYANMPASYAQSNNNVPGNPATMGVQNNGQASQPPPMNPNYAQPLYPQSWGQPSFSNYRNSQPYNAQQNAQTPPKQDHSSFGSPNVANPQGFASSTASNRIYNSNYRQFPVPPQNSQQPHNTYQQALQFYGPLPFTRTASSTSNALPLGNSNSYLNTLHNGNVQGNSQNGAPGTPSPNQNHWTPQLLPIHTFQQAPVTQQLSYARPWSSSSMPRVNNVSPYNNFLTASTEKRAPIVSVTQKMQEPELKNVVNLDVHSFPASGPKNLPPGVPQGSLKQVTQGSQPLSQFSAPKQTTDNYSSNSGSDAPQTQSFPEPSNLQSVERRPGKWTTQTTQYREQHVLFTLPGKKAELKNHHKNKRKLDDKVNQKLKKEYGKGADLADLVLNSLDLLQDDAGHRSNHKSAGFSTTVVPNRLHSTLAIVIWSVFAYLIV